MSTSFFKNIAVTYWTAQIYNDTTTNMRCEIDEEFTSPLVDAASNYVCSVERMELSGNNIFFYDCESDTENLINPAISTTKKCSLIYFCDSSLDRNATIYTMCIYGSYSSLGSLVDSLNYWKRQADENTHTLEWMLFSVTTDGKIRMVIQTPYIPIIGDDEETVEHTFGHPASGIVLMFSSSTLASIFGLPQTVSGDEDDAETWFNSYSDLTYYGDLCFQNKSSRIDCGIIPTMIQLRSTLPFESDQVSSTKTNIVTDFNIVANSASDFSLVSANQTKLSDTDLPMNVSILQSQGLSLGNGS